MNTNRLHSLLYLVLLLGLLPACSSPAAAQAPVQATPTKYSIHLQPCEGYPFYSNVLCGTLRVYENRETRRGRTIDLKVVVIKASGPNPAPDPIFYLAGGPGGAAASEDARNQQFPYSLSDNHDLVFVDQRGTGGSNQVMGPANQPDISGQTPQEMDATLKKWVADYLATINMDPRYYTTSVAMDDLDEVREALGYDQINLFGYSYGATAAQYYLRQHGEHVRTVTLGGGSLLDIPVFEMWSQRTQQALDNVFDLCAAQPSCKAAFPNIRAELNELMTRLAAEPKVLPYTDPINGQSGTINLDADAFSGTIRYMLKDAKRDPKLPLIIHRAAVEDDWQEVVDFILTKGGPEYWGDQIMERVIRCHEKWAAFDPAAVADLSQGSFMSIRDTALAHNTALSCQYTPRGIMPEGQSLQPGSNAPMLIINGNLDPIDPPANMEGANLLFPNSLALTMPYQAHAWSDATAISCYFSILDDFIQSGSVEGLKTSCLDGIRPPIFAVP